MPANRNDHTYKPIYTGTTRRDSWRAYDPRTDKEHTIWADSKEAAKTHAEEQGWTLQGET